MKYRLSPSPDLELRTQLKECEHHFQGGDFVKFLEAQKRFDEPVHVMKKRQLLQDTWESNLVYHYGLRKTLRKLPAYMQAVKQSGLNYEQGFGLLMHLFEGDKYNFIQKESDIVILAKALNASQGDKSLPRNIRKVKKLMSAGCGGSGMRGTLYSLYITSRLRVPVAQASPMIIEGAKNGYTIGPFNEALKSMLPANPNPELVVEAFNILVGNGINYWNGTTYNYFEQFMTFAAPGNGIKKRP